MPTITDTVTNYGTTMSLGTGTAPYTYAVIADVVKISPPEISSSTSESTNHGSLGKREYVASGLVGLGEMGMTVNYKSTDTLAAMVGTLIHAQISFSNGKKWTFDAIMTKFAPAEADAQNPATSTADISLQPTGENVIA